MRTAGKDAMASGNSAASTGDSCGAGGAVYSISTVPPVLVRKHGCASLYIKFILKHELKHMALVIRSFLCIPCGHAESVKCPEDAKPLWCPNCGRHAIVEHGQICQKCKRRVAKLWRYWKHKRMHKRCGECLPSRHVAEACRRSLLASLYSNA